MTCHTRQAADALARLIASAERLAGSDDYTESAAAWRLATQDCEAAFMHLAEVVSLARLESAMRLHREASLDDR